MDSQRQNTESFNGKEQIQARFRLYLLIILLTGLLFITYTYLYNIRRSENEAINLANAFVAFAGWEILDQLEATPSDVHKPAYLNLKNELSNFVKSNEKIRFAYLFVYRDGHVLFLADSEMPDSPAYSSPGEELAEFAEQDLNLLRQGQTIITPLVRDKWGTWVTVSVPVINPRSGQAQAAFGIDFPALQWYVAPLLNTGYSAALVIGLLLTFLAYYRKTISNQLLIQERDKLEAMTHKLGESEELFRRVFEKSPLGIAIVNDFRFISIMNLEFVRILGRSQTELTKLNWKEMTHPDDLQEDLRLFEQFKTGRIDGYQMNKRFLKPDGEVVWVKMIIAPLVVSQAGQISHHLCLIEDITENIKVSRELEESERSKRVLLQNLPGLAFRCNYDPQLTLQFVSEGCFELSGYKVENLLYNRDLSIVDLIYPEYRDALWQEWKKAFKNRTLFKYEYPIMTAGGETKWVYQQAQPIYNQEGRVVALEGLLIDINQRKMVEQEIIYLNYHDHLTGLYNRRFFEEEKLRLDQPDNLPISVIIGDINGLKLINDALGHKMGDKLILETARILTLCCRAGDILARTGGDEFGILLPRTSRDEVMALHRSMVMVFNEEAVKKDNYLNISLGYNTKEKETEDLEAVIKVADDNMYKHKLLEHKSSHSAIIAMIKSTMFNIIHETEAHASRLAAMARQIGTRLKLKRTEMDELELLATLHDIGKLGIDSRILQKKRTS